MTKSELKEYLVNEAEYSEKKVEAMDKYEMVDAWLKYNGIIGFTEDIIEICKAASE